MARAFLVYQKGLLMNGRVEVDVKTAEYLNMCWFPTENLYKYSFKYIYK